MMRSVTREMVGLSGMSRPLLVPADAVALRQRDGRRRPPCPGCVRTRREAFLGPGGTDPVDPRPLRLDLVAANEQSGVALYQVDHQPLVFGSAPVRAEGIHESQIERDFPQSQP